MAEALLEEFPTIKLGGPVTYSPPFQEDEVGHVISKTWSDWYAPLLKATADSPNLLGWVDYHAYDGTDPGGACSKLNCFNADAKTIDLNLQEITIVASGTIGIFLLK